MYYSFLIYLSQCRKMISYHPNMTKNKTLTFIRENDLEGGEALLARNMLRGGLDTRSVQFTLAFGYGSEGPKANLFGEAMGHTWQMLTYGWGELVRQGHNEFIPQLNTARRQIEITIEKIGIER